MPTPADDQLPDGFVLITDAISVDEERDYLEFARSQDLEPFSYLGNPSRRRVLNYGVNFDYEKKVPYLDPGIPEVFTPVVETAARHLNVPVDRMVELLVTTYPAGAGINWHRDSRPFESVVGVSLESDSPLKLRRAPSKRDPRTPIHTVTMPRRSMYLLTGEARTRWMHHVPPVREQRTSLTLRTVRPEWDVVGTSRPDGVGLHFDR